MPERSTAFDNVDDDNNYSGSCRNAGDPGSVLGLERSEGYNVG